MIIETQEARAVEVPGIDRPGGKDFAGLFEEINESGDALALELDSNSPFNAVPVVLLPQKFSFLFPGTRVSKERLGDQIKRFSEENNLVFHVVDETDKVIGVVLTQKNALEYVAPAITRSSATKIPLETQSDSSAVPKLKVKVFKGLSELGRRAREYLEEVNANQSLILYPAKDSSRDPVVLMPAIHKDKFICKEILLGDIVRQVGQKKRSDGVEAFLVVLHGTRGRDGRERKKYELGVVALLPNVQKKFTVVPVQEVLVLGEEGQEFSGEHSAALREFHMAALALKKKIPGRKIGFEMTQDGEITINVDGAPVYIVDADQNSLAAAVNKTILEAMARSEITPPVSQIKPVAEIDGVEKSQKLPPVPVLRDAPRDGLNIICIKGLDILDRYKMEFLKAANEGKRFLFMPDLREHKESKIPVALLPRGYKEKFNTLSPIFYYDDSSYNFGHVNNGTVVLTRENIEVVAASWCDILRVFRLKLEDTTYRIEDENCEVLTTLPPHSL